MSTQWEFVEIRGNGRPNWSWRRIPDGEPETVSACLFCELGMAVRDAIAHGFQPRKDPWLTLTTSGRTHFHPAASPSPRSHSRASPQPYA